MSIDAVLQTDDDQLDSQFQVLFPAGIPGGGSGDNIVIRMDQSVQIPRESVGSYDFFYKGLKITRPNMTDETEKTITLNVRIDQQWAVYDDILNWKRSVHNPITGTRLSLSDVSTQVLVQALDNEGNIVKTAVFNNCLIKEVEVTPFDHAGLDPSRLEMVLIFGSLDWE